MAALVNASGIVCSFSLCYGLLKTLALETWLPARHISTKFPRNLVLLYSSFFAVWEVLSTKWGGRGHMQILPSGVDS